MNADIKLNMGCSNCGGNGSLAVDHSRDIVSLHNFCTTSDFYIKYDEPFILYCCKCNGSGEMQNTLELEEE